MRASLVLVVSAMALASCSASGGGGLPNADLGPAGKALLATLPVAYRSADVDHGKQVFSLCRSCHVIVPGAVATTAPNLHEAWGAGAGRRAGYAYSDALKATGWTWDAAHLDVWLTDPQKAAPGTKMTFTGLRDADDRRDVIAYLRLADADVAP